MMVTGGRDYSNRAHVFRVLDEIHIRDHIAIVLHGACGWDADKPETMTEKRLQGADGLADEWARLHGIHSTREAAHWTTQGRGAGPRRNAKMVAMNPHRVVVFPGGPGTAGAAALATRAGLIVVREDKAAPFTSAVKP